MTTRPATSAMPPDVVRAALEVEEALRGRLTALEVPHNLRSAVEYGVLGAGKRLRPALVLLSCDAAGGRRESALGAACAFELVHCFSLVHDDLPAMDDDDMRRGRPTLHRHAGEAMAILAGDLMLSLAFETAAAAPAGIGHELAVATRLMIAGQVLDTVGGFEAGDGPAERLREVHGRKTGALFRGACRAGALCAEASPADLASLERYGECAGLMFQIVDDILDVTQSAEHLGKATGKDVEAGKLTWPAVHGLDGASAAVLDLRADCLASLEPLGPAANPLRSLSDFLATRTR